MAILSYEGKIIEDVLNALNQMQVIGVHNAKILAFVVQELEKGKPINQENEQPQE